MPMDAPLAFALIYIPDPSELRVVRTSELHYTEKQRCWFNAHCEIVNGPEGIVKFMSHSKEECQEMCRKQLDEINLSYLRTVNAGIPEHVVCHNPPTVEDYHCVQKAIAEFRQDLDSQKQKIEKFCGHVDSTLDKMRSQLLNKFAVHLERTAVELSASATKYSHRHSDEMIDLQRDIAETEKRILSRISALEHTVYEVSRVQRVDRDDVDRRLTKVEQQTLGDEMKTVFQGLKTEIVKLRDDMTDGRRFASALSSANTSAFLEHNEKHSALMNGMKPERLNACEHVSHSSTPNTSSSRHSLENVESSDQSASATKRSGDVHHSSPKPKKTRKVEPRDVKDETNDALQRRVQPRRQVKKVDVSLSTTQEPASSSIKKAKNTKAATKAENKSKRSNGGNKSDQNVDQLKERKTKTKLDERKLINGEKCIQEEFRNVVNNLLGNVI